MSRRLTAQERVSIIFETINHLLCFRSALDLLHLKQLQITVLCIFFYFIYIIWSDKKWNDIHNPVGKKKV